MNNQPTGIDPIPENMTITEAAEFWDPHSALCSKFLGGLVPRTSPFAQAGRGRPGYEEFSAQCNSVADYPSHVVECEYAPEERLTFVAIANDLLRQRDRANGISIETLVNLWIQEQLAAYTQCLCTADMTTVRNALEAQKPWRPLSPKAAP